MACDPSPWRTGRRRAPSTRSFLSVPICSHGASSIRHTDASLRLEIAALLDPLHRDDALVPGVPHVHVRRLLLRGRLRVLGLRRPEPRSRSPVRPSSASSTIPGSRSRARCHPWPTGGAGRGRCACRPERSCRPSWSYVFAAAAAPVAARSRHASTTCVSSSYALVRARPEARQVVVFFAPREAGERRLAGVQQPETPGLRVEDLHAVARLAVRVDRERQQAPLSCHANSATLPKAVVAPVARSRTSRSAALSLRRPRAGSAGWRGTARPARRPSASRPRTRTGSGAAIAGSRRSNPIPSRAGFFSSCSLLPLRLRDAYPVRHPGAVGGERRRAAFLGQRSTAAEVPAGLRQRTRPAAPTSWMSTSAVPSTRVTGTASHLPVVRKHRTPSVCHLP